MNGLIVSLIFIAAICFLPSWVVGVGAVSILVFIGFEALLVRLFYRPRRSPEEEVAFLEALVARHNREWEEQYEKTRLSIGKPQELPQNVVRLRRP